MLQTTSFKPGNLEVYMKIPDHISIQSMNKSTDWIVAKYDFNINYTVVIKRQ